MTLDEQLEKFGGALMLAHALRYIKERRVNEYDTMEILRTRMWDVHDEIVGYRKSLEIN